MRLLLICRAAQSGIGLSVSVELVDVLAHESGSRQNRRLVSVRLPDGETNTFQVRDLMFDNFEPFNVADVRVRHHINATP